MSKNNIKKSVVSGLKYMCYIGTAIGSIATVAAVFTDQEKEALELALLTGICAASGVAISDIEKSMQIENLTDRVDNLEKEHVTE